MSLLISRFAIGVVAAAAENNDDIILPGNAPELGVNLNINHPAIIVSLLVVVVGVQLILEVGIATIANRVVVPRDGAIATAQVLRSMTTQIPTDADSGEESGKRCTSPSLWRFRHVPISGSNDYDLFMEESTALTEASRNETKMETHSSKRMRETKQ